MRIGYNAPTAPAGYWQPGSRRRREQACRTGFRPGRRFSFHSYSVAGPEVGIAQIAHDVHRGRPRREDAHGELVGQTIALRGRSTSRPRALHRPSPDHFFAHIGAQDFGDHHAAILLLIVLDNRHPGAAHRQAAAVDGVGELGLLAGLVTDAGAPRLERFEVGAGGDFLVPVLPRQPDFDVVLLRRARAHVAGTEHHGAEGEAEPPQDILGVAGERVEFLVALLRAGELHQFHLLELVLADDAANVAAVAAGLAAETRRVGAELDGQLLRLQRLVAINIGDRDFGGRDQPEIGVLALEQVFGEFGKLAGAVEAGGIHQEGGQHFGVAVFPGMHVEEKVYKCALQPGAQAPVEREARAGDLAGAREIEDTELGTEVPMCLGLEVELRWLANSADFHVVVGGTAHRDGFVRDIGDAGEQFLELLVDGLHLFIERGDLLRDGAHFLLPRGSVGAFALELADFDTRSE